MVYPLDVRKKVVYKTNLISTIVDVIVIVPFSACL